MKDNKMEENYLTFNKYLRENQRLVNLHSIASEDYISFRCLYFNGMLNQAYVMAEQAIEKQLKLILLVREPQVNIRKYNDHKIEKLISRIQSSSDAGLDKFMGLAKRLTETYEMFRYPDNKIGVMSYSIGGGEIHEFDEFFFSLMDMFPLNDQVLFRTGLMVRIFEDKVIPQQKHFAVFENISFQRRSKDLEERFHMVRKKFYPQLY